MVVTSKTTKVLCVVGLLAFGCLNTLTSKIQFTLTAPGADGLPKRFEKPFFATFTMFAAMTVVLGYHYLSVMQERAAAKRGDKPLLSEEADVPKMTEGKAFMLIGIPATFDLLATGLMLWGLLLMSASIYQMLRGSMIIFAAFVRMSLFKEKLVAFHWFGVLVCFIGITCVGCCSVLNSGFEKPGRPVSQAESCLGVFLVVFAQVLQAAQLVVEEKYMKEVKLPPLQIVGYEGVWGMVESLVLLFPLLYILPGHDNGRLEDTIESFSMVMNNATLQGLILLYIFSCSTFNISSVMVSYSFNAIHRTMLEASRTSVIWMVGLYVHYNIDPTAGFGENWLPYSWLELVGFVFLLCGQMIYGEVIKCPCFSYPVAIDAQ